MGLNGMTFSISFIITPLLGTSVASDLGFNTPWIGSGVVLALAGIAMYFVVDWLFRVRLKQHINPYLILAQRHNINIVPLFIPILANYYFAFAA
jgi:hypothetical protein